MCNIPSLIDLIWTIFIIKLVLKGILKRREILFIKSSSLFVSNSVYKFIDFVLKNKIFYIIYKVCIFNNLNDQSSVKLLIQNSFEKCYVSKLSMLLELYLQWSNYQNKKFLFKHLSYWSISLLYLLSKTK
jgi:hypothetical protein